MRSFRLLHEAVGISRKKEYDRMNCCRLHCLLAYTEIIMLHVLQIHMYPTALVGFQATDRSRNSTNKIVAGIELERAKKVRSKTGVIALLYCNAVFD
jgi:hypothetical protein